MCVYTVKMISLPKIHMCVYTVKINDNGFMIVFDGFTKPYLGFTKPYLGGV
ncbi:hypothetical protein Hanom_Chr15g01352821 [Helianthus anomalus]